jgi:hypothetical protein
MTQRTRYTYAIARYTHDPVSGEFVNVGVVAVDMNARQPLVKFLTTYGRVKALFPTVKREEFLETLAQAKRAIKTMAAQCLRSDLLSEPVTAADIVRKAIPVGDQGIQLGQTGNGATSNLDLRVQQIFDRHVRLYEKPRQERKTDNDVWRPLRARFEQEQVADLFAPETITTGSDRQKFEHTWRNGKLHCVQPLSFDLSDGDAIREKARNWLGRLTALDDVADSFKAYLVVAPPDGNRFATDFKQSLDLLRKTEGKVECELVLEADADAFATRLAAEMRAHATT